MPTALRPQLYYALAAMLALAELAVLAIALRPDVSDTYRARYITGSSNCWLTDVSGDVSLGERIAATGEAGARISQLLRCGWLAPQPYGTWSTGAESKLRFQLEPDRPDLLLDLELLPFGADRGHPQQVTISSGGVQLANLVLDRRLTVARRIPIPATLPLDDRGRLEIDFTIPTAVSPRQLGVNDFPAPLGIRLVSLRLWAPTASEPVDGPARPSHIGTAL
ncbi:MAG: hypothetical protein ACTHLT_19580 [Devosia sp.]